MSGSAPLPRTAPNAVPGGPRVRMGQSRRDICAPSESLFIVDKWDTEGSSAPCASRPIHFLLAWSAPAIMGLLLHVTTLAAIGQFPMHLRGGAVGQSFAGLDQAPSVLAPGGTASFVTLAIVALLLVVQFAFVVRAVAERRRRAKVGAKQS